MLLNFTNALERNKSELDYHQYWRYTQAGRLPKVFTWLVEHPDLAEALAKDAREFAEQRKAPSPKAEPVEVG